MGNRPPRPQWAKAGSTMASKGSTQAQAQAQAQPAKCTICGKTLTQQGSVQVGHGPTCQKYVQAGVTAKTLQAHYQRLTAATPPPNFIKLATVSNTIRAKQKKGQANGATVGAMVRLSGGDRHAYPAAHWCITPVYVGRTRYIHKWLITPQGLTAIATGNFANAPQPPKGAKAGQGMPQLQNK
jgi:hypothetical protein